MKFLEWLNKNAAELTGLDEQAKMLAAWNAGKAVCLTGNAQPTTKLGELLAEAKAVACSSLCPSVKKEGEAWTHGELCQRLEAAMLQAGVDLNAIGMLAKYPAESFGYKITGNAEGWELILTDISGKVLVTEKATSFYFLLWAITHVAPKTYPE